MKNEFEAKFVNVDKEDVRKRLLHARFTLDTPEYLMRRQTFDLSHIFPGKSKWARVRQEADRVTMSIKEVRGEGIGDNYEIELTVDGFDRACSFLSECSMVPQSLQENKREVWSRDGVEVSIDTWPSLEPFVEVEAQTEDVVRSVSEELGFTFSDALFGSIDMIYEKLLDIPSKTIITSPKITFDDPPK